MRKVVGIEPKCHDFACRNLLTHRGTLSSPRQAGYGHRRLGGGPVASARPNLSGARFVVRDMKCPVDSVDLVMSERGGVEIDYCPQCRGVWLDRGELDKIIDRAADSFGGPASVVPVPAAPPGPTAPPLYSLDPRRDSRRPDDRRPDDRRYDDRRDRPRSDEHRRPKKKEGWLGELFDF